MKRTHVVVGGLIVGWLGLIVGYAVGRQAQTRPVVVVETKSLIDDLTEKFEVSAKSIDPAKEGEFSIPSQRVISLQGVLHCAGERPQVRLRLGIGGEAFDATATYKTDVKGCRELGVNLGNHP